MNNVAKIDRQKLKMILREELLTITSLSEKAGTSRVSISQLSSKNKKFKASPDMCKKILNAFDGKYKFDDIFYWV